MSDISSDPVDVREAAQAYLDAPGEGSVKRDAETRLRQALSRDISSDPVDEQIIRAYFWDIKNRIVQFEGEPTVNWLVRDLINSLHGNPPDPEEFNRILALVKEGKGDD